MKRILAIDPGPQQSAYVVWDGERILGKGICSNGELLGLLEDRLAPCVVIEMIASYGMSVGKDVFETCVWIGRFLQRAKDIDLDVSRIYRMEIKMHLCHSAKAKDTNVRQALIDRLGAPGVKANPGVTYGVSKDVWAALALAVTAYDKGVS